MNRKWYFFFLLSGFAAVNYANCQVAPESKIKSFSSRIRDPIDVDIQENSSGANLIINNQSYYRYHIQIKFTSVMNLRVAPGSVRNYILPYGFHRLGAIPPINKDQPIDLAFTSSFKICPSNYENGDFTYLYPIGNYKNMKEYVYMESQKVYRNMFRMNKNDTVFAMRKGIIVNTQENEGMSDRLGPAGSFEILHDDGTVMIYTGISRPVEGIKRGETVFPGQPFGLMDEDENVLNVLLCFIQPDATVTQMTVKYPVDYFTELANSQGQSDCVVHSSPELIMSEMSKSEKKKYLSGKLF